MRPTGGLIDEVATAAPADSAPVLPGHIPLVATVRGSTAELIHTGSVAVVDATGRLLAYAGDPRALNFARSTLKPVQALPFVRDGGPSRFGFGSHEVALLCASHSGEPVHVRTVRRMLAAIGARETDLQCGCHEPYVYAAIDRRPPDGASWSPLEHNCSGKHAGFLAYCRLHGHRLPEYLGVDSPLQIRIRNTVAEFAGGDATALGIDGCSAPNIAMPLARLAGIYARLATDDEPALAALRFAMTRHPDLVSGTGRTDLLLSQRGGGDWMCKGGADGVQAIGVRSRGLGIAIRIADGDPRARKIATASVLRQLDLVGDLAGTPLADWVAPAIRNIAGIAVGDVRPVFQLRTANA